TGSRRRSRFAVSRREETGGTTKREVLRASCSVLRAGCSVQGAVARVLYLSREAPSTQHISTLAPSTERGAPSTEQEDRLRTEHEAPSTEHLVRVTPPASETSPP